MADTLLQCLIVLILMLVFLGIGEGVARGWGFYRREAAIPAANRFAALDGLRGFLALAVFLHHAAATREFLATSNWRVDSRPFQMMGGVPVTLFFMMTGFLFWLKALRGKRRVGIVQLYRGRIFRIVPLYFFSALAMFGIILAMTGMPRSGEVSAFFAGAARLLGGAGILPLRAINGIEPGDINASVLWTLHNEWGFYLLLPALALVARPAGVLVFASLLAILHFGFHITGDSAVILLLGMAAAQLFHSFGAKPWAGSVWVSVGAAILTAVSLLCFTGAYNLAVNGILFVVFLAVVQGNSLGGILTSKAARTLGSMSYSIYLLHGIILFLARPLLAPLVQGGEPGWMYWAAIGGLGTVVIGVSGLTYRWIEYPFIALEHRLKKPQRVVEVPSVAVAAGAVSAPVPEFANG